MIDAQVQKVRKTIPVLGEMNPKEKFLQDVHIHRMITHGKSFSMIPMQGRSRIEAKSI